MRKVFVFALGFLVLFILGHFSSPKAYAIIDATTSPNSICKDTGKHTIIFSSNSGDFDKSTVYSYAVSAPNVNLFTYSGRGSGYISERQSSDPSNPIIQDFKIEMDSSRMGNVLGVWKYKLWKGSDPDEVPDDNSSLVYYSGEYTMYPIDACTFGLPILEMLSPVQMGKQTAITVRNINPLTQYVVWFTDGQEFLSGTTFPAGGWTISDDPSVATNGGTGKKATLSVMLNKNDYGEKTLCLKHGQIFLGFGKDNCEVKISITVTQLSVNPADVTLEKSGDPGESLDDYVQPDAPAPTNPPLPCAEGKRQQGKCLAVNTAIGEISTDPAEFVQRIFSVVLGLSGGIALIMIIISGYQFMVSQGNPETIKAATGQLTSAVVGLLFIIFSFVILQIVGVDILQIPGFGK